MDNWKNEEPELSPPANASEVSYVLDYFLDCKEFDYVRHVD